MAGQTRLVRWARIVENAIDAECASGPGRVQRARYYRRELLELLETADPPACIQECGRGAAAATKQIERHLRRTTDYALPKALYDQWRFGTKREMAARSWGVTPGELAYVRRLASRLSREVGSFQKAEEGNGLGWMAEVEEAHTQLEVTLSDQAVGELLMPVLEGYAVSAGPGFKYTEVYGILFGMGREVDRVRRGRGLVLHRHILAMRASTQLRAAGAAGWVTPNDRSFDIQLKSARLLFPELEVVGDFHSHPSHTVERMMSHQRWRPSGSDEELNREWVELMRSHGHRPRLGLMLAVARAERRDRYAEQYRDNILRLALDEFRVLIAGYPILADGTYGRRGLRLHSPALTGV
jgi:hypothetical protein